MKTKFYSLLVFVAILLTGCSKSSPILETIPADVVYAGRIDVVKLMEAAGVKVDGDNVECPDYFHFLLGTPEADSRKIVNVMKAVDPKDVYLFQRPTGSPVVTAAVADKEKLESILDGEKVEKSSRDGFDCYNLGNVVVLVRDTQAWIVVWPGDKASAMVDEMLKTAADASLADVEGAADALSGNDMLNVYITSAMQSVGTAVKMNIKGASLVGEFELTGSREKIDSLVNNSLVVKIGDKMPIMAPEKPLFFMASGFNPAYDWNSAIDVVTSQIGFDYASIIKTVQPICEQLDGPAVLWANTTESISKVAENPFVISGLLEASVKDGGAVALKDYFGKMMSSMGLSGDNKGDNIVYSSGPLRLEIGGVAKRFEMKLGNPQSDGMKDYTSEVKDYSAVMMVNIPTLRGILAGGKSWGVEMTFRTNATKGDFVVTLTGSNQGFLPTLLSM